MEGRVVSHYRVLESLGHGGMGVVYRAEDTRLHRIVALKFLSFGSAHDQEARARFEQEARAASALDHPNICTIHEIDTTDDGQLFLAMAFCDGESLAARLQRGPLSVAEALDTALQMARGLEKAHQAGIVHRDIKPANVMITSGGLVKIVDFGVAKMLDHTGPTRTGTTLGTLAFMAPEQVKGQFVDQRTDLWSLGVVLFNMIAGRRPFNGDPEAAVLHEILTAQPPALSSLRPEVPPSVDRLVGRLLMKDPGARYQSASEVIADLTPLLATGTTTKVEVVSARPSMMRKALVVAGAVALIGAASWGGVWAKHRIDLGRAEPLLAEATALAEKDQYTEAFARLQAVEPLLRDDQRVSELWPQVSVRRSIETDPPGATVAVRAPLDPKAPWIQLGQTPLTNVRIPGGMLRWRIEKDGFEPQEFAANLGAGPGGGRGGGRGGGGRGGGGRGGGGRGGGRGARGADPTEGGSPAGAARGPNPGPAPQRFTLTAVGTLPPNMLAVPGSSVGIGLIGFDYTQTRPVPAYLIDKFEVTNRAFKQFVDAGGYEKSEFWTEPIVKDGRTLAWREAMAEFRDQTGRPGPSTWEAGTYPTGHDDYPVSGVSWYEASAFAAFSGKSLPTVYHWLRAANPAAAAYTMPLSNLGGDGPVAIGTFTAVTSMGAYDMAGNVREWCINEMSPGTNRYILGGAWNEPRHMFQYADSRPPFDRSESNGFRLMNRASPDSTLTAAIPGLSYDVKNVFPVSDAEFDTLRAFYRYDPHDLDPAVEAPDNSNPNWTRERVTYTSAYGDDRVAAYLFIPKNAAPPFKTVVFFPEADAILSQAEVPGTGTIGFLMTSGHAVLYPVYDGTFERNTGQSSPWPRPTKEFSEWLVHLTNDVRRGLDYLETRKDIQQDAIAYFGDSWGAAVGPIVLPHEQRLKTAILASGGLALAPMLPEISQINAAPRVKIPVLMIGGDADNIFPLEASQKPLFELLGTPKVDKEHKIYPAGHGVLNQQRNQVRKDILDWLERHLGPVKR